MNTSRRCRMMGVVGIPSGAITSSTGMVGPEPVPGAPRPPRLDSGSEGRQVAWGLSTRTLRVMRLRPKRGRASAGSRRVGCARSRQMPRKRTGGRDRETIKGRGGEREEKRRAQNRDQMREGTR
jgi:hypothetical protein